MRLSALIFSSALIASPALAADLGTYRPGTPYHSVVVPTANVCESQCEGDARCRGWNYVKAAPQAPGVCEFQSNVGEPVSSAISISGISGSAPPLPSRVVRGNTNTIRVGTQVAPRPQIEAQSHGQRHIVRQPVPPRTAPGLAGPRVAVPGLAGAARSFQPALESAGVTPPAPQPMSQNASMRRPVGPRARSIPQPQPGFTPQPQPGFVAQPQIAPSPYRAVNQGRPPIGQPISAPTIPQNLTQNRPIQPSRPMPTHMPRASAASPVTWGANPSIGTQQGRVPTQNLYGGLYDDVGRPVTQLPLAGAQPR